MSRDVVLGALAIGLGGAVIWLAGWWPGRDRTAIPAGAVSGRRLMDRSWRRLWRPLLPAAIALAVLAGWALQEPVETDEILRPLVVALILPVCLVWLRGMARAVLALRRPRVMPPLATAGLLRPRIAIDGQLQQMLDPRALAAAIAHERAHARHRDPLRIWLAQIATDAQWPNPMARRRFHGWLAALEIARDEEARREGTAGADLAAAIVAVAAMRRRASARTASRAGAALACLTGAEEQLKARIHRLLAPLPADGGAASRAVAPAIVLAALAAGALVGLEFGDSLLRALPFIAT